jgi:hypothetical protein
MRKLTLTVAALALCAGAFAITNASAMPLGSGLGQTADGLGLIERSQYFYGDQEYCWYPDGWHGPGFYWCGYNMRPGYGWGGPMGWRGWRGGEGRRWRDRDGDGRRFEGGEGRRWRGGDGMRFQGGPGVGGPGRGAGPRVGAPGGGAGGRGPGNRGGVGAPKQ